MDRQTSLGMANISHLCRAFHLSRQALHAASKPCSEPLPRPQRPGPWAEAETLKPAIRRLVEENPAWGIRKVWADLRLDGLLVSRKRVYALMKALGLLLPPSREGRQPVTRGHVTVPESNRRWATDLTTVWTKKDGLVAVMPVVDCGDRYCFEAWVSISQESRPVLAPVRHALVTTFATPEGVPDGLELRTDHGPQYTGGDCREFCAFWRLDHTFAPVARPTGNADPQAFLLSEATSRAVEQIGWPEARIPLAQAVIYVANAPKSNATVLAVDAALAADDAPIPEAIRDAHTSTARKAGRGKGYHYSHDDYDRDQAFLPEKLRSSAFYEPQRPRNAAGGTARNLIRRPCRSCGPAGSKATQTAVSFRWMSGAPRSPAVARLWPGPWPDSPPAGSPSPASWRPSPSEDLSGGRGRPSGGVAAPPSV
jgi:transposase InsO family protein